MLLSRVHSGNAEWLLLDTGHETILYGAALPLTTTATASTSSPIPDVLRSLPWATIDLVLVPTLLHAAALPFITEYTAFRGAVLCSEPTAEFGRLRCLEWIRSCRNAQCTISQRVEGSSTGPAVADLAFNEADIKRSFGKVTCVRFGENKQVGRIIVRGVSAGLMLGATNWIVTIGESKIVFFGDSGASDVIVKRVDLASLQGCDVLISAANATERQHTPMLSQAMNDIWKAIHRHLDEQGSVVFAVHMCGHVFELVEIIDRLLNMVALTQMVIHLVSTIGRESFLHANIQGEWMSEPRIARIMTGFQPLTSEALEKSRRLAFHQDLASLARIRQANPRIIIATDAEGAMRAAELLDSTREVGAPHPVVVAVDHQLMSGLQWQQILACPFEPALTATEVLHECAGLGVKQVVLSQQHIPSHGLDLGTQLGAFWPYVLDASIASHRGWGLASDVDVNERLYGYLSGSLDIADGRIKAAESRMLMTPAQQLKAKKRAGSTVAQRIASEVCLQWLAGWLAD
ncbi:beta-lactamase-like protein [Entophlyctis helioformis]|nr:beta-lactamase-like protein [Entophlyctis helioformis]